MNGQRVGRFISLALGAGLIAGCATTPQPQPAQDKAGTQTLVLKLGAVDSIAINGLSFGQAAFIEDLETVSGGLVKADVITSFGDQAPDAESQLVRAIASGDIDGGWPSTRAFANAGITGLEAVEAPLTITNYAASKALVSGPVATDLLDQLNGTGVVGLGLAVGPLRRPFAAQAALVEPADWKGATFRSFNSPVQTEVIRALGATPVIAANDWVDQMNAGTLRGAEFDIEQYFENGATQAPYVTANVVLWPKVFVLALSQKRFDAMSDQQRAWVQQAAEAATKASVDATYDESAAAAELCARGVHFVEANSNQLAQLRDAVSPVIKKLAADPLSGPILTEIQAVAARYPQVEEPTVPPSCHETAAPSSSPGIPEDVASLPDGVYREEVTVADAQGPKFKDPGLRGTWTLTVDHGTFALSCRFIDAPDTDCGQSHADGATVEVGRLRGTGNTVYFVGDLDMLRETTGCLLPISMTLDGHCVVIPPYWFTWSLDGDQLTFKAVGGEFVNLQQFSVRAWTRIS